MPDPGSEDAGPGIIQSLRSLGATVVALLWNRFDLLATELEEERIRLLQLLFWAAGAIFFFGIGILLIVVFLVALFWDSHRFIAIVSMAGIFLAAGIGMAMAVRRRIHEHPRLFSASLEELAKDKDRLTSR